MSNIFKTFRKQPQSPFTVLALGADGNGERAADAAARQTEKTALKPLSSLNGRLDCDQWATKPLPIRPVNLSSKCPLRSVCQKDFYAAEEYRIVRTKAVQMLRQPLRLVITSPSTGDGKTLTAINLAVAMAIDHHVGPARGQRARDRAPDVAARAGDDRRAAGEGGGSVCHCRPPCVLTARGGLA